MAVDGNGRDVGNVDAGFESQLYAPVAAGAAKLGGEVNQLAGVVSGIVKELGNLSAALGSFGNTVDGYAGRARALNDDIDDTRKQMASGASAATQAMVKDIAAAGAGVGGSGAPGGGGRAGPTAAVDAKSVDHYIKGLGVGKSLLKEHIASWAKMESIGHDQLLTIQESVFWQGRYTDAHKRTKAMLEDQLVLAGSQLKKLQANKGQWSDQAAHAAAVKKQQGKVNASAGRYTKHLEVANKKAAKQNTRWKNIGRSIASGVKKAKRFADAITGLITGKSLSESLNLKQIARDQFSWTQEIAQTRFQQGESASLAKKALEDMDVRLTTGQDVVKATKSYLKVFRQGMKDEKKALKVTKEGLTVASLIGSNAEETVEFTRQLTMEFGLANLQMSAMSREMRATATATGLVGDELLAAVKSSEKFMKNLRAAGTFTTEAAGQLMRMTAEAQKLNVGETMGRIQELMSGRILEAQGEPLANLLYLAASRADETGQLTAKLMAGMAIDAKSNRKMFEGTEAQYQELVSRVTGGRAENLKEVQRLIAAGQLDPQQLIAIQRSVKGAFGVDAGELETVLKGWKEATLTFTERWSKLQKKNSKKELEKLNATERLNRQLEMSSAKFHEASTVLSKAKIDDADFNAFIEVTKGKAAAEALRGAPEKERRALLTKDLFKTAVAAQLKVEKAGGVIKARLTPDVLKDALSIDADTRDSALEKINDAMAQANVANKEAQDPITKIESSVSQIREIMQFTIGGILMKIANWVADAFKILMPLFQPIWDVITEIGGLIMDILEPIWEGTKAVGGILVKVLVPILEAIKSVVVFVRDIVQWLTKKTGQAGGAATGAAAGAGIGFLAGGPIGAVVGGVLGGIGGWVLGGGPEAQKGGFVEKTGMAKIHQGETIVPVANLPRSGTSHTEDSLRAERVTGAPDATAAQLTQDMSGVEGNTSKTVAELKALGDKLGTLVDAFTKFAPNPTPDHPEAGDSRARRTPRANANYYTWQMSRYTSNANKGVGDMTT